MYKIEKNISIPWTRNEKLDFLKTLEVWDSFTIIKDTEIANLRNVILYRKLWIKLKAIKNKDKTFRVWRVL